MGCRVGWSEGVYISADGTTVILDPLKAGLERDAYVFISHAHADHTRGFSASNLKYSTQETRDLYERLTGRYIRNFRTINFGEKVRLDGVEVTAVDSGHMLGSAQFKVETSEATILYTGDLNCVDTLTTKPAEVVGCDVLIIEATYGIPYYVFPLREETYLRIVDWVISMVNKGRTPCFRVYASGKAQEIIRLINTYTTLPVFSDIKVASICDVYNSYGLHLDYDSHSLSDGSGEPFVYVTSSRRSINREGVVEGRATGWALTWRRNGCFPPQRPCRLLPVDEVH